MDLSKYTINGFLSYHQSCSSKGLVVDYSLFTYRKEYKFKVLLVYVDDLILKGNDPNTCAQFKAYSNGCFHIEDLGPLKYFWALRLQEILKNYSYVNKNML